MPNLGLNTLINILSFYRMFEVGLMLPHLWLFIVVFPIIHHLIIFLKNISVFLSL